MPKVTINLQKNALSAAVKLASAAQQEQLSLEQVLTRSLRSKLPAATPNKKAHDNAGK